MWKKFVSLVTYKARSEDFDQSRLNRLAEWIGWSESLLVAQAILLVLSCSGSYSIKQLAFTTRSIANAYWTDTNISTWLHVRLLVIFFMQDRGCTKYNVQQNIISLWATTWQNQQNECAPTEDSDQPGHPPSLIRVFAVCMKKPWILSYPLSAQRRMIRLGGFPGWSEASLGAHSFCWFCHVAAHIINCK